MTQVFLSGANGFIGAQIAKHLVEKGYNVIGSVRSTEKGEKLKKQLGLAFTYEVVPSFLEEGAFNTALKKHPEVTAFLHSASPVIFQSDDPENDVLLPAIQGTLNALKSAHQYGPNIKKFIYTSSLAAMYDYRKRVNVTESLWNDVTYEEAKTNSGFLYGGSKTFAEKGAWEFIDKEKPSFTLTTVNPVYVFGPLAFDDDAVDSFTSSSSYLPQVLKTKKNESVFEAKGTGVDVRDVVALHIAAVENDLSGKRLLASCQYWDTQIMLEFIKKTYPELGKDLPEGSPGSIEEGRNSVLTFDNSETTRLVGIKWTPLDKSFKDAVDQILRAKEGR